MTAYLNQYRTPWWCEQVPWACFEYDGEASLHLAVSYLSLGFWWCVQPHSPVVWCMQWWEVLVDGSVDAEAAGAVERRPARATAAAGAMRRARNGVSLVEVGKCRGSLLAL